jgi:hypothetical protein
MGVEAAASGLPVLCVGYHELNKRFWSFNNHVHHRIFLDKPWCVTCYDEGVLIPCVQRLLELAERPETAIAARNDVRHVAAATEDGFASTLVRHLRGIADGAVDGDYRTVAATDYGDMPVATGTDAPAPPHVGRKTA